MQSGITSQFHSFHFILFESGSMAHRTKQQTHTQTHTQKRKKEMSQPCYKTEVTEQCPQNSNRVTL